ncbi:hypothetical protein RJ640_021292 [Escallonia rubra]|uniref:AB hydrolase-1 domain-containing protein n=1 Tax=Escallonia rubra TaxID=112253 RepID=A0AA88UWK2_9ASTE|nr:hypothetical protein RJ640_021292 [Escallonia rubra]
MAYSLPPTSSCYSINNSTTTVTNTTIATATAIAAANRWSRSSRAARVVIAKASEKDDGDTQAFNPFGFVTDNPSSRSAIQLPESPAEDGNRTEDKGKEYGSYIKSGKFRWFVRETGSPESRRGTVVFLHGAPTQSYSYRVVMSQMADAGFHCFAPDWIGFGFSDKPQPGYGFDYTGSYGLTWALKNPNRILKLAILNSPLTVGSPIPGLFQQLSYVLKLEKADVYRLPYLSSSGPGFALLEVAKKANFKDILSRIAAGFALESWDKPVLVAWGISDKYLPQSIAEEFQKGNPASVKLKLIEGAGHMPQEDWIRFLKNGSKSTTEKE